MNLLDRMREAHGSFTEMRFDLYGGYMDGTNLGMPVAHLLLFMQEIQCSMNTYRGLPCNKSPCDAWVYQEIIHETQPQVIIELGRQHGGSTLWLYDIARAVYTDELEGYPRVVSVDIEPAVAELNKYPGIWQPTGNSEDKVIIDIVKGLVSWKNPKVMVIDDCAHTYDNVLANLRNYGPMVTPGCYYIVEDTFINHIVRHPDYKDDRGAMVAVFDFIKENDDFQIDRGREKFFITSCPNGFLKRMK